MTVPAHDLLRAQTGDLIKRLRAGELDATAGPIIEALPPLEFVHALRSMYRIAFLDRVIGRKTELGLAKSLEFQLRLPDNGRHLFGSLDLLPVLRGCLLVSIYDTRISGVTVAKNIRLRPVDTDVAAIHVAMGEGFKLDRMPDGWVMKSVGRKSSVLPESLLRSRGWNFSLLQPFSRTS